MARPGQAALPVPLGGVVHRHHDAPAAGAVGAGGRPQRGGGRPPGCVEVHAGLLP